MRRIFTISVIIILSAGMYAQVNDNFSTGQNPLNPADSLTANDSVIVKNAFLKIFTGKPGKAALYSLILPGAGQLYNKKYWKAPIAWAIDGALIYNTWYQSSQYRHFQNLYLKGLENGDANVLIYKENRDKFRKDSEFSWLYLLLGHILTVMDAYVDRHLMEFDISPDLTYHHPYRQPAYAVTVRIPVSVFFQDKSQKNLQPGF